MILTRVKGKLTIMIQIEKKTAYFVA
jgi:hypothetical protein